MNPRRGLCGDDRHANAAANAVWARLFMLLRTHLKVSRSKRRYPPKHFQTPYINFSDWPREREKTTVWETGAETTVLG